MTKLFIGPLLCIIGMLVVIIRKSRNNETMRELSTPTCLEIEEVAELEDPYISDFSSVPAKDIIGIYLNSRAGRMQANKDRLDRGNPNCLFLLNWVERDHRRIRNLAAASLAERGLAKLIPTKKLLYSRVLLWTYGEQVELLHKLTEYAQSRL